MSTLFEHTHSRTTDPPTSRMGARAGKVNAKRNKDQVLDLIRGWPDSTVRDIANLSGQFMLDPLDEHEVGRRVSDLAKEGRIVATGIRERSRTWRAAQ